MFAQVLLTLTRYSRRDAGVAREGVVQCLREASFSGHAVSPVFVLYYG